jgi:TolB-like protein
MSHMKKIILGFVCGSLILIIAGCANNSSSYKKNGPSVDVVSVLKQAHKPLFDKLVTSLESDKPIISASFANIDNLSASSTFGRMASEVISAGLTKRGYKVVEVKMRESLFIKQRAGEFMLSRHLKDVSKEHDAQAVVLGTYAIGGENLYVSARVVRTTDSVVIGSHDFSLPLNRDIRHMLKIR